MICFADCVNHTVTANPNSQSVNLDKVSGGEGRKDLHFCGNDRNAIYLPVWGSQFFCFVVVVQFQNLTEGQKRGA